MKKKYTKAKVEIISMKTEAFICASPDSGTGSDFGNGGGDKDNGRDEAKAFDGNGINDFSFDPTPSTKE